LPIHQEIIKSKMGDLAIFANPIDFNPRPSTLAILGDGKAQEDVHTFTPNYIRIAEAEANWLKANKNGKKEDRG
jgi:tRNA threonylcarbamoyladenosine biosynthesis protein TsaB